MATSPSALHKSLWNFYNPHQMPYPELWKVVQLLLTIPIDSAACERGFSKMKVVKTNRRNWLTTEQLNSLMTISLVKLPYKDDELISRAISIWHKQKKGAFPLHLLLRYIFILIIIYNFFYVRKKYKVLMVAQMWPEVWLLMNNSNLSLGEEDDEGVEGPTLEALEAR